MFLLLLSNGRADTTLLHISRGNVTYTTVLTRPDTRTDNPGGDEYQLRIHISLRFSRSFRQMIPICMLGIGFKRSVSAYVVVYIVIYVNMHVHLPSQQVLRVMLLCKCNRRSILCDVWLRKNIEIARIFERAIISFQRGFIQRTLPPNAQAGMSSSR